MSPCFYLNPANVSFTERMGVRLLFSSGSPGSAGLHPRTAAAGTGAPANRSPHCSQQPSHLRPGGRCYPSALPCVACRIGDSLLRTVFSQGPLCCFVMAQTQDSTAASGCQATRVPGAWRGPRTAARRRTRTEKGATHRPPRGTFPPTTEHLSHRLAPGRLCDSVPTWQSRRPRFREYECARFMRRMRSETLRETPKVTAMVDRRAKADLAT